MEKRSSTVFKKAMGADGRMFGTPDKAATDLCKKYNTGIKELKKLVKENPTATKNIQTRVNILNNMVETIQKSNLPTDKKEKAMFVEIKNNLVIRTQYGRQH